MAKCTMADFQFATRKDTADCVSSGDIWEVKNNLKFQTVISKSGCSCLQEVPSSDLTWKCVLEKWPLMGGGHKGRLDCIYFFFLTSPCDARVSTFHSNFRYYLFMSHQHCTFLPKKAQFSILYKKKTELSFQESSILHIWSSKKIEPSCVKGLTVH